MINFEDFIDLLAEICQEKGLRAAASECLKGGLITGVSAIIGGLLLGPLGLAIGGAVGGGASAISAKNKFKPVAEILLNLPPEHKQRLYEKCRYTFRNIGPEDAVALIVLLRTQSSLKNMAVDVVKNYLKSEFSLQVL